MSKEYYFISDLHIGGDGLLNHCDFEEELIGFLQRLAKNKGEKELIIIGDAFGLWELTQSKGLEKLRFLVHSHARLFDQFKATAETIQITLIPGNHDYELACHPEYIPFLEQYGIHLDPAAHIMRETEGHQIWIEHGNQHDSFNTFEYYGNPASTPVGYYITSQFVGAAGELSKKGRGDWLKDIQAVYPTEHIPHWVFSNYFYREMSPMLRYLLLPFLLLFTLSLLIVFFAILEHKNLLPSQFAQIELLRKIGGFSKLLEWMILANTTLITFFLVLAIPLFFIGRDVYSTLRRYKLMGMEHAVEDKANEYDLAAQKVFDRDQAVKVFIYGHTHEASLKVQSGRAIINTGTWIKKLTRVEAHARFLPDVYAPSYCLSVFCIRAAANGRLEIAFEVMDKKPEQELTWLQRLVTFGRRPEARPDIPPVTIL